MYKSILFFLVLVVYQIANATEIELKEIARGKFGDSYTYLAVSRDGSLYVGEPRPKYYTRMFCNKNNPSVALDCNLPATREYYSFDVDPRTAKQGQTLTGFYTSGLSPAFKIIFNILPEQQWFRQND